MHRPWNRAGLRWYLIVIGLTAHHSTMHSVVYAVPFLSAGIALHLWAKGYLHQRREVTVSGPYRFIRHPFYMGNLLLDFSIVIMSGWLPLIGLFPIWWIVVYLPEMRREESVMSMHFGQAYGEYMAHVPRLIPARRPLPSKPGFSWRNFNLLPTEVPRCLRFLSYPFLFLFCSQLGKDHLLHLNPMGFYSLLLFLLFNGLSYQVRSAIVDADLWQARWLSNPVVRMGVLTGFVVVGLSCTYLELEPDALTIPMGLILTSLSLWIRWRISRAPALVEAALLIGACILWELPWLSIVPLLLCLGPWLATRLSQFFDGVQVERQGVWTLIPHGRLGSGVFSIVCLLGFIAKEIIVDSF